MDDGIFTVGENILPEMMPPSINKEQRACLIAALGDAYSCWVNEGGIEYSILYPAFRIEHGVIVTPSVRYDGTTAYTNDGDELEVYDDCLTIEALVDEALCPQKNAADEIDNILLQFPDVKARWMDKCSVVLRVKKRLFICIKLIETTLVYVSFNYYTNSEIVKSDFIVSNNQIQPLIQKMIPLSKT